MDMPITHTIDPNCEEDGVKKEAAVFTFTNGARDQLKELMTFFGQSDELETLKLAISFLQRLKEQREAAKSATTV